LSRVSLDGDVIQLGGLAAQALLPPRRVPALT
jgi:hypothetical protein